MATSFLQLLENTQIFKVGTKEILQETLIADASVIWMFFETHIQVWNVDNGERLYIGKEIPGIFFYTLPAVVDRTTIATVRLQDCDPQLQTYNVQTNQVKTLAGFPDEQQNYMKLFYFEETGDIVVWSKGKQCRLYLWDSKKNTEYIKQLPFTKYGENDVFEKYAGDGTLVTYNGSNNSNTFKLLKGGQSKEYSFDGLDAGLIKVVKRYSNTQAVVAVVHNVNTGEKQKQNKTTVILFNLQSKTILKKSVLPFPVDNVLKVSDNWIGIATLGQDLDESNVKVKVCFSQVQDDKYELRNLPRALRIWNDYMPIMTVSYEHKITEQIQQQIITTVKCAPKRSIYIKFLQESGIIDAFGNEIVKEVTNNLN